MEIYYTTIPAKDEDRADTVLSYLDTTLYAGVTELDGIGDLGQFARTVFDRFNPGIIELVWILDEDGNATDIFYNTEENTIRHIN